MCEERRGAYSVLIGKSKKQRPPGSHRHRNEDNIEMNVQEIRQEAETGLIWLKTGTNSWLL